MMKKKVCAPATKEDLSDFREEMHSEFESVRVEMSTKADLDEKIGSAHRDLEARLGLMATKKDLESMATKTDLSNLDKAIRTEMAGGHRKLALQIERQQNEARASEARLAQKMDSINTQVKRVTDPFAGKANTSVFDMALHGRELTDVHVGLKDHERRIAALEARPGS